LTLLKWFSSYTPSIINGIHFGFVLTRELPLSDFDQIYIKKGRTNILQGQINFIKSTMKKY